MFHVYVLRSDATGRFCTGSTQDVDCRLVEHNSNCATATKNRGPWRLVYWESFATRKEAMARERHFQDW
ncbi:MAG TPA: GIY-YIG nuclease family protein [Candidatus Angelobacter sp.]